MVRYFYLSFLGPNHYGLIAFVLLTQASLNLLDAGLGQSLVREVSSSLALPDGRRRTSRLILNIERLYWGFALIVALIIGAMSTYISAFRLKLDDLPIVLA